MNVIVTGGEGFLGIHLCIALREAGHTVISVDNHSTSDEVAWKLACEDHPTLVDVQRLYGDVGRWDDPPQLRAQLPIKNHPPDAVFHLACPASPKRYKLLPLETLGAAILGAYRLLDTFEGKPVIIASTSEVYGEPLDHPQKEDLWAHINPRGERVPYEAGKLAGEAIAQQFANGFLVRIHNTYGPYMHPDDGRVVSNFICQALKRQALTIYGGNQTRSFCYATDLATGLVDYMNAALRGKAPKVVNLGNPEEITITQLAEAVSIAVGYNGHTIVEWPMPEDDPSRRCPDITLAQGALGFFPKTPLGDGLDKTITYFKRRLDL